MYVFDIFCELFDVFICVIDFFFCRIVRERLVDDKLVFVFFDEELGRYIVGMVFLVVVWFDFWVGEG